MNKFIVNQPSVQSAKTRKEFITNYIKALNPTSYYENGEQQCKSGANRSIHDIWIMVKSRFPKTSLKAIIRILRQIHKEHGIRIVYCNGLESPVVCPGFYPDNKRDCIASGYSINEYGDTPDVFGIMTINEIVNTPLRNITRIEL